MSFWVLIFLIALLIAVFLSYTMLRSHRDDGPTAAYDLRVYREQLASVDRDLARGVIAKADAERVRTEISRRILAADAQMRGESQSAGPPRLITIIAFLIIAAVLVGGGLAMYRQLGAAGFPDMPLSLRLEMAEELRANRPSQTEAEGMATPVQAPPLEESYETLLNRLRETVAERPDDLQGQTLLAQHETNAGNFKAGYEAQTRVIALSGETAPARAYSDQAEMMILAAGGYVSPEAENALRRALELDPSLGPARYYWGQMLAQTGRPDMAYRVWVDTLRDAPAGALWADAIRAQIDDLAFRAGVFNAPDLSSPPAAPGPSQEDMTAAAELTPEERQEMIRGMVDRLSERLASEGGAPEEWARLIAALGVLGDIDRAASIRDEALSLFAGNEEALQMIDAASAQAGIAQ
ncbi:cytochrome c-type biogenesis protein CcmH [Ruegeria halocynthiae]|uniref:Cytochrome c-type biogenesis protein CcmH n=1 Tax=Ruegeria halocynthiae TaxID=985054 RepID=A0A1H2S052_9RHOB|nr:c-type cytochrome biogenesis protein CcmI [Ruegeria halocynthiae]SDW24925.1 cytochrome c-type biogenesis protein CcmH [Ruegeria halocynthiae]